MLTASSEAQEERLLSYVIASSNMRYIEVNERDVYLRQDPQLGLILRGEVPHCGPGCNANLSQMLLEYTMSCEDCRDQATKVRYTEQFGHNLGQKLLARLNGAAAAETGLDRLSLVLDVILNSLGAAFQKELAADRLRYELAHCPIHEAARDSGQNLWVAPAHRAFVVLCRHIIEALAPGYMLAQPAEVETEAPLETILIVRE